MTVKLCKDCEHYNNRSSQPTCNHPSAVKIDLVTGEEWNQACVYQRWPSGGCKEEGIYFTPKKKTTK
jgi:hypothetical protein